MSTQFDPYTTWLCLDCSSGRPTHYELLDLSPAETDTRKIENAARQQLAKLNSIDAGPQQKLLEEVKAKVKNAFAVISNSAQRAKYDLQLASQPPPTTARKSDLLPPKKASQIPVAKVVQPEARNTPPKKQLRKRAVNPDLLPPAKATNKDMLPPGSKVPPPPAKPVAQFDPPKGKPSKYELDPPKPATAIPVAQASSAPAAEVPQAKPAVPIVNAQAVEPEVPTARAVPTTAPPTGKVQTASPAVVASAGPAATASQAYTPETVSPANPAATTTGEQTGYDNSQSIWGETTETVFVDSDHDASSRTNWMLPVLGLLFSAIVVGGAIYGMGLLKTDRETASNLPQETRDATTVTPNSDNTLNDIDANRSEQTNQETTKPNKNAENDRENLEDTSPKQRLTIPVEENNDQERSNVEPTTPKEALKSEQQEQEFSENDVLGIDDTPKELPRPSDLLQQVFNSSMDQQWKLKTQMLAIKNLWLKQDYRALQDISLPDRLKSSAEEFEQLNEAVAQTSVRLEEFWTQFRTSCTENQGDIEVDGRVVGFVEAARNHLTLKIAGTIRRYDYRFVPPGLMMEIIDRNAIEDIPAYRLQKAAYLISQLQQRPDLGDDIEELLRLSEADGHDVYHLRLMAQFPFWELAQPKSRVAYRPQSRFYKKIPELAEYRSLVSIQSNAAEKLAWQLLDQAGYANANDVMMDETRMNYLEVARQLAVRSGDTLLAMDIVDLVQFHADKNVPQLQFETLEDLAVNIGDPDAGNWYCDRVLAFLRSDNIPVNNRSAQRLGSLAAKRARDYRLNAFEIQLRAKVNSFN